MLLGESALSKRKADVHTTVQQDQIPEESVADDAVVEEQVDVNDPKKVNIIKS